MKKSQVITLVVLVVVLGLCVAGYFFGKQYFADKEKKDEEAKTTSVLKIDTPNVIGFAYSYNDKTYTIAKEGDTWKNVDDPNMKLKQGEISTMIAALNNIKATTVIKKPSDIEQYGFKKTQKGIEPSTQEIFIKTKDNKYYDLYIGAKNPYDNSAYYMMVKDDDNVYVIEYDTISQFQKTVNELEEEATSAAVAQ